MLTESNFSDSDHWNELAKDMRYDLPRWNVHCTIPAMQLWLDRFDITEKDYELLTKVENCLRMRR